MVGTRKVFLLYRNFTQITGSPLSHVHMDDGC